MTFFDSSTPVPNGQDSPSNSVKAPVLYSPDGNIRLLFPPLPFSYTDVEYYNVVCAMNGDSVSLGTLNLYVGGSWDFVTKDGSRFPLQGVWPLGLARYPEVRELGNAKEQIALYLNKSIHPQPVQLAQANAVGVNGQESPVSVKAPELSPVPTWEEALATHHRETYESVRQKITQVKTRLEEVNQQFDEANAFMLTNGVRLVNTFEKFKREPIYRVQTLHSQTMGWLRRISAKEARKYTSEVYYVYTNLEDKHLAVFVTELEARQYFGRMAHDGPRPQPVQQQQSNTGTDPVLNGQEAPSVKAPEVTPKQMGFCPKCKQLADFRNCHEGHADYKCPHCSHVFHKTEFCHFCCLNCNEVWPTSRIALDWDDTPICADCDHELTLADDLSPQPVQLSQANAGGPLPDEDWEKEQSQNDRKTEQSMYSQEWANDVQETPSVKAPVVPERDPLFFMGGEYEFVFHVSDPISIDEWTVANVRNFCNDTGLTQDQILPFLQFVADTGNCDKGEKYLHLQPTWELVDEFVAQNKAQEIPSVKAPELLTEDEIRKIYNLISAGLERAEYDRLIDIVIDLNNYAKVNHLAQLLEMRGLLEQIDEAKLCNDCHKLLWPVLDAGHKLLGVSVSEKAGVGL